MGRKINPDELDRIGRRLFSVRESESEETSSEAVFLAGFRQKLHEQVRADSSVDRPFGEICWRLSPVTVVLCAFLTLTLYSWEFDEAYFSNAESAAWSSPTQEILWTLTESGTPDVSREQVLEAVLTLEEGGAR